MSNFYQGVNIKSISLFILTIITLAACSKQDPTKFKPSQLNGTWTGSENQNALVINTTKETFQYGDMSCVDMPSDFSSIKDDDTTNYTFSFSYTITDPNGIAQGVALIKKYNVKVSFTSDSECEVSDERYFSETFKKTSSQSETTFNVSNLAGSWKSADGAEQSYSIDKVDGKISGSGSSSSDIFIGKEIPNWKTTTDMVPEFEFEITHSGKIDKFRFISSTKGYVNDKLYYRQ